MRRKCLMVLTAMFALVLVAGGVAVGDETDTATVTVDVESILTVEVEDVGLVLEHDGGAGYESDDATEELRIVHNLADRNLDLKIVNVDPDENNLSNNITLTFSLPGRDDVDLVDDGDEREDDLTYETITDSLVTSGVTYLDAGWEAHGATLAGTPAGDYIWDVTFEVVKQ